MPDKTVGVILGGGIGARLHPLTRERSKPAVPFGGKYRLVDVPISNCLNSGIRRMFVLTQKVDAGDLIALLPRWGACGGPSPPSLEDEILCMGLDWPEDWNTFNECLGNATSADDANCICWFNHYYNFHCLPPPCPCPPNCPGSDPWGGSHNPY